MSAFIRSQGVILEFSSTGVVYYYVSLDTLRLVGEEENVIEDPDLNHIVEEHSGSDKNRRSSARAFTTRAEA